MRIKRLLAVCVVVLHLTCVGVQAAVDTYTVQPGDTLWVISKKYKVGISEIIKANPQLKDPNMIFPGDKVYVPLVDEATKGMEEQILALVNKERNRVGVAALSLNWELSRVARHKSEEMRDRNYFDHTSPVYGSPFDMLKKFNISFRTAGENIAKGQKTAEAVMNSWMNSEGHRKNILSANFTELGVGYAPGSTTYWTQMFIKQ